MSLHKLSSSTVSTLSYLKYNGYGEDRCVIRLSNDTIGRYLLKLQEKTVDGDTSIDMYKIGEGIGLVDKIQTDHIVEILLKDGYIRSDNQNSEIRLTEEGHKRLEK
jgi:hypothetical protein